MEPAVFLSWESLGCSAEIAALQGLPASISGTFDGAPAPPQASVLDLLEILDGVDEGDESSEVSGGAVVRPFDDDACIDEAAALCAATASRSCFGAASASLEGLLQRARALGLARMVRGPAGLGARLGLAVRMPMEPVLRGSDLVSFLVFARAAATRPDAVAVARAMIAVGLLAPWPPPADADDGLGARTVPEFEDRDGALYTLPPRIADANVDEEINEPSPAEHQPQQSTLRHAAAAAAAAPAPSLVLAGLSVSPVRTPVGPSMVDAAMSLDTSAVAADATDNNETPPLLPARSAALLSVAPLPSQTSPTTPPPLPVPPIPPAAVSPMTELFLRTAGGGAIGASQSSALLARKLELETRVLRRGWLTKQGHVLRSWRRRWFVLVGAELSYYVEAQSSAGSVPSSAATAVAAAPAGRMDIRHFVVSRAATRQHPLLLRLKRGDATAALRADAGPAASAAAALASAAAPAASIAKSRRSPRGKATTSEADELLMLADSEEDAEGWFRALDTAIRDFAALRLAVEELEAMQAIMSAGATGTARQTDSVLGGVVAAARTGE